MKRIVIAAIGSLAVVLVLGALAEPSPTVRDDNNRNRGANT